MKEKLKMFAKKNWYFIVIILGLIIMLLVGKCNNTNLQKDNELKSIELSVLNDSVKTIVGKHGELTAKLEAVTVEVISTKKALEAAGFEIKDLKDRDINWRKTTVALKLELKAANEGRIILRDTTYITVPGESPVNALTGEWNDGYLFLKPLIIKKQMDFKYQYQTGINFLLTPERKKTTVNIWLTDPNDINVQNPYGKITRGNSIVVSQETPWYMKPWLWGVAGLVSGFYLGGR